MGLNGLFVLLSVKFGLQEILNYISSVNIRREHSRTFYCLFTYFIIHSCIECIELFSVASLVLTCVSNGQVHSLNKNQAFSLAVAFVRIPGPIGIWPC